MPSRSISLLPALALSLVACGDAGDGDGAGDGATRAGDTGAGDVVIVSRDIEFEPVDVEVPAGREIEIVHENEDAGTNHNLHLTDAPGSPSTPLEQGPATQVLTVTLEPGTYHYVCDLHPAMRGTLRAS